MFSIAISRPAGDKWQLKTQFLSILDPRSSIAEYVFDSAYPVWLSVLKIICKINLLELNLENNIFIGFLVSRIILVSK